MGIFDLWGLSLRCPRTRSAKGVGGGSNDPWRQGRRPGVEAGPRLRASRVSPPWFKEGQVTATHTTV